MGIYQRKAELLEAEVAADIVGLDPVAGRCFGFNEVAATVWRYLSKPRSFEEIELHLRNEFDVESSQCASELQDLLADMESKGLICRIGEAGPGDSRSSVRGGAA